MRTTVRASAAALVAAATVSVSMAGPADADSLRTAGAFRPNAGTIVEIKGFVAGGAWHYQIWRMHADGTHAQPITTDPDLLPYTAAVNPAGNRVAFSVGNGSRLSAGGLYVTSINGYGRRNLLAHSNLTGARDPSWSHDGKRLAFVGLDHAFKYDIWIVGSDGRGLRRVTHCNCAYTNTPRWSPTTNAKILWSPNTDDVAILNPATGRSTELYDNRPSGAMTVLDYDWLPDGKSILMSASPWNDTTLDLYRLALATATPVALTQDSTLSYTAPHASPSGKQLVTSVFDTDGTDRNGTDLWLADATNGVAAGHREYPGAYQEAPTAWTRNCRTHCAPGGRWSTLSASFTQTHGWLRMTGGLLPGRAGAAIRVTLAKQVGRSWRAVRSVRVTTSQLSVYTARLRRANASLCHLTARWGGSTTHRAVSVTTRSFGC